MRQRWSLADEKGKTKWQDDTVSVSRKLLNVALITVSQNVWLLCSPTLVIMIYIIREEGALSILRARWNNWTTKAFPSVKARHSFWHRPVPARSPSSSQISSLASHSHHGRDNSLRKCLANKEGETTAAHDQSPPSPLSPSSALSRANTCHRVLERPLT